MFKALAAGDHVCLCCVLACLLSDARLPSTALSQRKHQQLMQITSSTETGVFESFREIGSSGDKNRSPRSSGPHGNSI